jgi:gamma-glutamylputrescine oxidase
MIPTSPIWASAQPDPYPAWQGGAIRADVAVIGGGFTGLSAAYHILARRPGARVVVLEGGRLGEGASGRTTGMLGPGVGQSLPALVRRLGEARAGALYRATLRAVEDVCALVEREHIECDLLRSGQLIVARSPAARARVEAQANILDRLGLPCERLDDEALGRAIRLTPIKPARQGELRGPAALRLPNAGTLHPVRLLAGLAERVTARGGAIFEGARVLSIGSEAPVRLAMAGGGEVCADEVIIATAGYTPGLGVLSGRILPVHLQVLVTEPLSPAARSLIGWGGREGVLDTRRLFNYFRLTADDRIVFGGGAPRYHWAGATDDAGPDGHAALDRLARELEGTFDRAAAIRVAGGWTGVIGYVLDALPAIQRMRGRSNVLHAVGWCGHGVALSLASGAWITRILCEGAAPEDLPWYRDDPPGIPLEPLRWLSFRAAIAAMSLMDRMQ